MDEVEMALGLGLFNLGVACLDTVTLGQVSATLKTKEQLKKYINDATDALYTLHVETFMKTIDIQENEWKNFLEENPDEHKIGVEALSILKQITFEYQAEMMAIALNLKIKGMITLPVYHKYTYIILRMNKYLFELVVDINKKKRSQLPSFSELSVGEEFNNPELIGFGFLIPRVEPSFLDAYSDFDQFKYKVSDEFIHFYEFFIKRIEEKCIT